MELDLQLSRCKKIKHLPDRTAGQMCQNANQQNTVKNPARKDRFAF